MELSKSQSTYYYKLKKRKKRILNIRRDFATSQGLKERSENLEKKEKFRRHLEATHPNEASYQSGICSSTTLA